MAFAPAIHIRELQHITVYYISYTFTPKNNLGIFQTGKNKSIIELRMQAKVMMSCASRGDVRVSSKKDPGNLHQATPTMYRNA